jgi:hypothetical protein
MNAHTSPTKHKYPGFKVAIISFALCLLPSVSNAVQPNLCGQAESGERLKCKFQNILDQQEESANKLASMGNIPKERTDKLKRQTGKAMATHGKTETEDFKQLTKKNKSQCDIVELMNPTQAGGNGDGICDKNETCAEDNSDQFGNNDGVCSPMNGKNREICLQICDEEALRGNPNNFDDSPGSQGADIEQVLDDVTGDYVELNTNLDEGMAATTAFANQASSGSCDAVLNVRPTKKQLDNSFMAAYIAENLAEQFDNLCGADVFGVNIHYACIVTDGIYLVAKGIADTITSANEDVDSQTIDATLACVRNLQSSNQEQQQQLDTIKNKLDTTLTRIDETIQLLKTPQGLRSGFNKE